jgi:putative FmdB family regulatory protein
VPTYEYRCKACGHELEIVQRFSDDALTRCESCGADQLRKVFGSVGISFKGSGFYKNDSRGKSSSTTPSTAGEKTTSSSDSAGSGSPDSSSSTSSDSKSSTTPAKTPSPSSSSST